MTLRSTSLAAVDSIILPPTRDLGDGFQVRRALPSRHRRMVGPFIFFDQMGPAVFKVGDGLDVRPHPHIGLSTITYLLAGGLRHRDSIGSVQDILPGDVNWMTAGSGITHSERTRPDARSTGEALFGLQAWVALPAKYEETKPAFAHHRAASIPWTEYQGMRISVIAGGVDGMLSPVGTLSDLVYADVSLAPGARYQVRKGHVERAIYVIEGALSAEGQHGAFGKGELVVFKPDAEIVLRAAHGARFTLLGGEPLAEQRFIYWNFVSSRPDRLEQAKSDWSENRFAEVPDESDPMPLPEMPAPVRYP